MSTNKKITQIPVGTVANWGALINQNFNTIDTELTRLYQRSNELQGLVGANVPYINMNEDSYFVSITFSYENGALSKYVYGYHKANGTASADVYTYNIKRHEWDENKKPPMFLGAYIDSIIDQKDPNGTEYTIEPGNVKVKQGDLLVRTQQYGSLYGESTSAVVFKVYPLINKYYLPEIKPVDGSKDPYLLRFKEVNAVEYYQKGSSIDFTLPAIGHGSFVKTDIGNTGNGVISGDIVTYSYTFSAGKNETGTYSPEDYMYHIEQKLDNKPVLIYYTLTTSKNEASKTITVSISYTKADIVSGLTQYLWITSPDPNESIPQNTNFVDAGETAS